MGASVQRLAGAWVPPLLAVVASLIVGGLVILLTLHSWTAPFEAYWQLFLGAFGTWYDVQESLTSSITLIFTALAVAIAFRAGLFNLGVEGQMYAGAILSTFIGITVGWSPILLLPVAIIASGVAGAIWALIPALAKVFRGTHEIVTTMMLNYVALYLMHYLLANNGTPGPMAGSIFDGAASPFVNARLPIIVPSGLVSAAQLNLAFPIALVCCAAVWFLLSRTTFGYRLKALGFSPSAARYGGVAMRRTVIWTFLISGFLAGLAGSAYVFGVGGQLQDSWDGFGTGFDAIAIALLGRNTPQGALLAAILFGAMDHGGLALQVHGLADVNIIVIIQGLVILFVACEAAFGPLGRILKGSLAEEGNPKLLPV